VGDVIQLAHKVDEPLIVKYQQLPNTARPLESTGTTWR
jgi:hypothetical protein